MRCLWHVVIDTNDIEFVTRSFLPHEKDTLKLCISSILAALESLKATLLQSSTTTFHAWRDGISSMYNSEEFRVENNPEIDFEAVKEIVRPNDDWKPQFSPQATIQHSLYITVPLYFSLFGLDTALAGSFLANPNEDLVDQALGLLEYLGHFEYNLYNNINYGGDIMLKTMTAIKKY